tara:strand:+ start:22374 stop:22745 length:372 start_codon:yes stop_codon:yes gene_type:complete
MKNINIEKSLKEIIQNFYSVKKEDLLLIKKKNLDYIYNEKKVVIFFRILTRIEVLKYTIFQKNEIRIVYRNENFIFCKRLFPNLKYNANEKGIVKKLLENLNFFLNPNFKIISLIFLKKKNGF